MSLLEEIRRIDPKVARSLQEANYCTDAEIRTLSRQDLNELLPESHNLKLRKTIYKTIHKQKSIEKLLKDLQGFVPHDSLKAALTNNGVLVDYLHILKDMKTQLNTVQGFLDAHIRLLEDISKGQPEKQQGQVDTATSQNQAPVVGTGSASDASVTPDLTNTKSGQREVESQKPQTTTDQGIGGYFFNKLFNFTESTKDPMTKVADRSPEMSPPVHKLSLTTRSHQHKSEEASRFSRHSMVDRTYRHPQRTQVSYKMVVSGKTFNAHLQILDRIKGFSPELSLVDVKEDQTNGVGQVKFVFCPVVSRVGSDVEAAMKGVTGSEPVILVLMHHCHEAKHVASVKTWAENLDVALHVNVFYHESLQGLVQCKENEDAISAIRQKLLGFEKR
ncbi:uncharacterized protein LOC108231766 [Kryptolebias marmoratus]|uniref:uncharacterized protein LOC108231766 n=1 Tax=Kryptolebias marmoratus TaxID=37003 RepID=UPI000D52FEF9|nr:uncharacterized protein LOC108231766 [Kryptolebias marmoratus]